MKLNKLTCFLGLFGGLFAATQALADPHFFLQMENRTNKNVTVSFQKDVGNVYLKPVLADHTAMSAHQISQRYGLYIEPLDRNSTFNIIFTGTQNCTFNVAFFAPGRPKITTYGLGCYGGGYQIVDNGSTLSLFVSDIKASKS